MMKVNGLNMCILSPDNEGCSSRQVPHPFKWFILDVVYRQRFNPKTRSRKILAFKKYFDNNFDIRIKVLRQHNGSLQSGRLFFREFTNIPLEKFRDLIGHELSNVATEVKRHCSSRETQFKSKALNLLHPRSWCDPDFDRALSWLKDYFWLHHDGQSARAFHPKSQQGEFLVWWHKRYNFITLESVNPNTAM